MKYKGAFVDDTPEDAVYANLLTTKDASGLDIEYLPVDEAPVIADKLFNSNLDIVILDFRLDENPSAVSPTHAYKAGGLAQLLRDKSIESPISDFPIVLLSAEQKFDKFYRPDATAHDLFDAAYAKENVATTADMIVAQLISLCSGYHLLRQAWREGTNRLELFGLPTEEQQFVDIQELRIGLESAGAPHIAAKLILRDVINRTGILYSDADICARLGVTTIEELLPILNSSEIAYTGIFSQGWRRWWAHRFDQWADVLFGRRPLSFGTGERVAILSAKLAIDLQPAASPWNGSLDERLAFACASCDRPTETRHSLSVFDPKLPRFSQKRRVCWDCIQTEKYKNERLVIEDVDVPLVEEINAMGRNDGES